VDFHPDPVMVTPLALIVFRMTKIKKIGNCNQIGFLNGGSKNKLFYSCKKLSMVTWWGLSHSLLP